jgi:hypothetical protein
MPVSYTVILFQRQHFGNEPNIFAPKINVPFVGLKKDFTFDCPDVDPRQPGFLLFQSLDVSHDTNVFQINGVDVFGGIPVSATAPSQGDQHPPPLIWNGNISLVETQHNLKPTGNVLHVESKNADDFILDNIVIVYKTRGGVVVGGGTNV